MTGEHNPVAYVWGLAIQYGKNDWKTSQAYTLVINTKYVYAVNNGTYSMFNSMGLILNIHKQVSKCSDKTNKSFNRMILLLHSAMPHLLL